jgi:arylsulfatase A-like enzyme
MLPNLVGESKQPVREAIVHHSINGTFAIRQGKWKLIDAPHSGGWSRPKPAQKALYKDLAKIQLYDLKKDPAESRNVSVENPSIVKKLKTLLEKYREDGRSVSVAR